MISSGCASRAKYAFLCATSDSPLAASSRSQALKSSSPASCFSAALRCRSAWWYRRQFGRKVVFHVEHAPVQKPPPPAGSFFQQLVNLGVDDLRWELLRHVRDTRSDCAPDMPFRLRASCAHAKRHAARRAQSLARQKKRVLALGDQQIAPPTAERASAAQEERGLKQAGLARGIRADKKIGAGVKFQLDRSKTSEPLGAESAEWHSRLTGALASRRSARSSRLVRAPGSSNCRPSRQFRPHCHRPPPTRPADNRH